MEIWEIVLQAKPQKRCDACQKQKEIQSQTLLEQNEGVPQTIAPDGYINNL